MKNIRGLPIPFLVLILAAVVSLFSIVADRSFRPGAARSDSLQMQTVEQERMAVIYFRILSWLSDVTPRTADPAKVDAQPAPQAVKPQRHGRLDRFELCILRTVKTAAAGKSRARNIN
jgi:hypothetical protein